MKGIIAIVAAVAALSAGCDSPVSPTTTEGVAGITTQAPRFRNYADTVPQPPADGCVVRSRCCFDRRPHWHCP